MRKLTKERLLLYQIVDEDEPRPELTGVWVEEDGATFATDAVAIVAIGPSKASAGEQVLIPTALAEVALRMGGNSLEPSYELRTEGGRTTVTLDGQEYSVPSPSPGLVPPQYRGKTTAKHLADTPRAEFRVDVRRLRDLCEVLSKLGNREGMRVVVSGETDPILFLGETDSGEDVVAALMPMQLGRERPQWARKLAESWRQKGAEPQLAKPGCEEGNDG